MNFPFDIKSLDEMYKNSESGNGGYFPLGKGVLWHSGIHINSNNKETFSPILDGKVVLYRISKEYQKVSFYIFKCNSLQNIIMRKFGMYFLAPF